jgi:hypothetical protein
MTALPLRTALRSVREDLRDLDAHPLVSRLVAALDPRAGDDERVSVAYELEREFATEELSIPFLLLSQALDHLESSGASDPEPI